ncbi:GntR family transcriptional regulator [Bradyrhizobium iriomotense]|uniref:GntR family transcriptional regulator n=1 Tax=Bradyrhizobium iriomotense TaxID=441950 RepID=UPI001B89E448|nr:GntR family transcriptional regulator [Bradyrhizobium iriomotense]MBR0784731.1 GntR family transcriptional regulator [Bradyrhizobium iriomotense]
MTELLNRKVSARSLVDTLVERIEAAIISGELQPGSKVREQTLAASLGVSRGPLREAIRRLEGRKLLERTPNIGVRVAAISPNDLYEVLQLREVLEGLACSLAATNMTDEELEALSELLDQHQQQRSVQEGTGYYQESKDFDFHFRIVKGSRNARLIHTLCEDLYYLLRVYRYKSSTKPGRAKQALKEHKDIVAALVRRDPEEAERRMRLHIRNARRYVEEQVLEAPTPKDVERTAEAKSKVGSGRQLREKAALTERR